jgi:2-phospho-L-lactate guanylyltransferase
MQRGAVVLPIKGFTDAKARLEVVLSPENRAALAEFTAGGLLEAVIGVDAFVVCDNDDIAQWARQRGALVVRQTSPGLNAAVACGVEAAQFKHDWVLVAHSDMPYAEHLMSVVDLHVVETTVTLVPDRHEDGTNVLVIPARCGFTFHYGPGSFAAHQAEATRLGLAVRIVRDERLALDIDTPDDLAQLPEQFSTGDFA